MEKEIIIIIMDTEIQGNKTFFFFFLMNFKSNFLYNFIWKKISIEIMNSLILS